MASIKTNIVLNALNTASRILFPLVTFPYASRVLEPEGIGVINFLNGIIGYILLLTTLGVPMYAVKMVARHRDDAPLRDRITTEVILLCLMLSAGGYVLVGLLAQFVPQIHSHRLIFFVLSAPLLFDALGVSWFYQAMEDFRYITVRELIVRSIFTVALFIFVHDASDLLAYAILLTGSSAIGSMINFLHLRKFISRKGLRMRELRPLRHLPAATKVFAMNLITSLYVFLNSIMLGFISGDAEVGYFTAGTRIPHIALVIIGTINNVLFPRCAYLLQQGDREGFSQLIHKSLGLIQGLAYPLMVGIMVLSSPLIMIFCGPDYGPSVGVMLLNAPVILAITFANLTGVQVLYPLDKLNILIMSVSVGAVVNLGLNLLLMPRFGALGAAIATLVAEFGVLTTQLIAGRGLFPFTPRQLFGMRYLGPSLLMGACAYATSCAFSAPLISVLIGTATGFTVYAAILILNRDPLADELALILKKRFQHTK
ncbi:MAG: flippase [Muribaculaceae bacterium]|nr:flippase [Muribaculaceae bacterium]